MPSGVRSVTSAPRVPSRTTCRRGDLRLRAPRVAVRAVVAAQVAEVDRVVDVRSAAAAAVLGVRRVRHALQRDAVVLDADVEHAGAVAAEVGDERVVGVQDERGARRGRRRRRPSGRRSSRARRSGRAGRGRGWRAAAPGGARSGTTRSSQNSSTSNRPRSPSPSMSAVATPPAMFAPARLWTSRTPPRPRIEATIAAVVVLPFVALMIGAAAGRRAATARRSRAAPCAGAPGRAATCRRARRGATARRRRARRRP